MGGSWFSKLSFVEQSFSTTAPDWRNVSPGLNINGRCHNYSCKANNENVWISKGFCEDSGGSCNLNAEVNNLKCPICSQKIYSHTVSGLGIYQCRMRIYSKYYEDQTNITSRDSFQYTNYQHSTTADYIAEITKL